MTKVIIIGGKGTAVVVAEQIQDARERYGAPFEMLGFAFDDPAFGTEINGIPVLCKTFEARSRYERYSDVKFIFQIYRSDKLAERVRLRESYGIPAERYLRFIHPSAYVARSAQLGFGCVVCANCVIDSNVRVGDFNTMHSGVHFAHDTCTGASCFIAAHACLGSSVVIGSGVFIGLNASVRTFVRISDYAVIGMASNVITDVPALTTVVGNPARPLKGKTTMPMSR